MRALLITGSIAYLSGHALAAAGWDARALGWLIGSLGVLVTVWWMYGLRAGLRSGSLLFLLILANVQLQRTLDPQLPPEHLRHLALPQQVTIAARIFRQPEIFPHRGRIYLEAVQIWQDGVARPAAGKILLTVRTLSSTWQYGDLVRLSLRLRAPRNFANPGGFDYESYLARQGIYLSAFLWDDRAIERRGTSGHSFWVMVERARDIIGQFFDSHLSASAAAVLRALIIGDDSRIDNEMREAFSRAGVAHVLSVSGLHLSLVATAVYGGWWWLLGRSRFLLLAIPVPQVAAVLTVPLVLIYACLAGDNVATWRATIMVLVYLLAVMVNRHNEVYRSLALAAVVISLLWPGAVLDISFQLSFLSVLSILLGLAHFSSWWPVISTRWLAGLSPERTAQVRWGAMFVVTPLYAFLGTAPMTAFHFNQIALAGLFTNLILAPLLGSVVVLLGLLTAGLLAFSSVAAHIVLSAAGILTQTALWLIEQISAWPYAAVQTVTPTLWEVTLIYGLIVSLFFCFLHQESFPYARVLPRAFTALLLLDGAVWIWDRFYTHDLRVTFLDVGQGDAAVVEFPGSPVMVIDGGGFASENFDPGEAIVAPFLWSRKISRIDILVMSHPQLDHYGGLVYLAETFAPREFWFNGEHAQGERYKHLFAILERRGVRVRAFCRDMRALDIAGVRLQVLHPPCGWSSSKPNNASLVLRLSYGTTEMLFTGDVEAEGEQLLLAHSPVVASDVVKIPHHGSRTSSTWPFVKTVRPQVAIASVGYQNRFRFPAPDVVQRYRELGAVVLRTDEVGAITVVGTRKDYRVYAARSPSQTAAR